MTAAHIVEIALAGDRLAVRAPYDSRFVAAAKDRKTLKGKWNPEATPPAWEFAPDKEDAVRALCRTVYGDDGITSDLVTVRVTWTKAAVSWNAPFFLNHRRIAAAFGRKTGAKLGDGVTVLQGGFGSGGTYRDWETTVQAGTVALVGNVPRAEAERFVAQMEPEHNCRYAIEPEIASARPTPVTRKRRAICAH